MRRLAGVRARRVTLALIGAWLAAAGAHADVSVTFDVETLNAILPALTLERVEIPLASGRAITVELAQLRITGLEPAGGGSSGSIRAALLLRVPSLGLELPVAPRLALAAVPGPNGGQIELRFVDVPLAIPLVGSLNLATFLPPMRFPSDRVWQVEGGARAARVQSRLTAIEVGQSDLVFRFALETAP